MSPQPFVAQSSIADSISAAYAGMIATTAPWHIGHFLNSTRKNVTVTPVAVNSSAYTVTLSVDGGAGVDYTFTSDGSATVAEITAGLTALINAGTQAVTAVDNTTTMSLIADNSGVNGNFTATLSGAGTMTQADVLGQGDVLAFGRLVRLDSTLGDDRAIRLPRAAADITTNGLVAGVVLATAQYARVGTADTWPAYTMIDVMRKGHVLVQVEQAVTPGQNAFARYAAGGNGLGSFGNTAGSTERAAIVGATYRSTAAINALAVLEVNFSQ